LVGLTPVPSSGAAGSMTYYFAEGTTRRGFTEVLYLANRGSVIENVNIEFSFADGAPPQQYPMQLGRYGTTPLDVASVVGNDRDVSAKVTGPSTISVTRVISILDKS